MAKKATKPAADKAPKAKKASPAWMKELPAITKIRYKGEQLAQKEFFEVRATTMKIESDQVRDMMRSIATGQDELNIPDDVDKATSTRLEKAFAALQKDFKAHKDAITAEKSAKEDELKAKEDAKESASTAMAAVASGGGSKLVKSFTATVDQNVSKIVGEYFTFDADHGTFTKKDGVNLQDDEVVAETLGKLSMMSGAAEDISSQAALREAQFVLSIRGERPDWNIFFDGRDKDLKRIKQYVRGLDTLRELGSEKLLEKIPFSTLRPALECRFDKDDESNAKKKKEAVNAIYSASRKEKRPIPQLQARNIIAGIKGGEAKKQLKYVYLITLPTGVLKVCGSEKENERLQAACIVSLDRGTGKYTMKDDEDVWQSENVELPDDEVQEYVAEFLADNGIETEEVEDEEVETEEVEETDDTEWDDTSESEVAEEETEEESSDDEWA